MKPILLAAALTQHVLGAPLLPRRGRSSISPYFANKTPVHKFKQVNNDALSTLRGGDIGGIDSKTLAKTFTGLVSLDAISGTFLPAKSLAWFGVDVPDSPLCRFSMEGIGGMAGGVVITSLLAMLSDMPVEKAIAYGMLSPILFFLRSFVNPSEMATGTPQVALGTLVYGALALVNLLDVAKPILAMKILFGLDIALTTLVYFSPGLAKLFTGIDAESEGKLITHIFRCACGYEVVYSTLCFLLLQGVDPVKSLGYVAALVAGWVLEMGAVTKIQDYLPKVWWANGFSFAVIMVLVSGLSLGILSEPAIATIPKVD